MTCIHCHKEIERDPCTKDYYVPDAPPSTTFKCADNPGEYPDHEPEPEDAQ